MMMMTAPRFRSWLPRRGSCRSRTSRRWKECGRMLVIAAIVCVVLVLAWTKQEALEPLLAQRAGEPLAAVADDEVAAALAAASTTRPNSASLSLNADGAPAAGDGQGLPTIAPAAELAAGAAAAAAGEAGAASSREPYVDSHLPPGAAVEHQAAEGQGSGGQDVDDMQEADEVGGGHDERSDRWEEEAVDFSEEVFAADADGGGTFEPFEDDDDDDYYYDGGWDDDDVGGGGDASKKPARWDLPDERGAAAGDDDDDDDGNGFRAPVAEEPVRGDEPEEDSGGISLEECQSDYGIRRFMHEEANAAPPILYSYPGSGNTWTRYLIDFATGIYTGTAFFRRSTKGKLLGQGKCSNRVSAVKAHPQHFSPEALFSFPEGNPHLARCKRAGHIDAFDRFVLLVRDPYDAIWSEYRRRTGAKVIRRNDFNRTAFATAARKMTSLYMDGVVAFRQVRRTLPKESVFNLKYEDMLDEDIQLSILQRLMNFIGLNDGDSPAERRRRARCAFQLAEAVGGGRRGSSLLKKTTEEDDTNNPVVTAREAYTPRLACEMWSVFGDAVRDMGYSLPEGMREADCRRTTK